MSASHFHYYDEIVSCLNRVSNNLQQCVDFWLKHSHDKEMGGFFNCLTTDGKVYDTTKYGWLQGRQIWMYCQLYMSGQKFHTEEILQAAIRGGDFLMSNFKDAASQKVYFSATRDGKPIKMQRTIFSEVFYCMAMAGLFKVTKESKYKDEALSMFRNIVHWSRFDPKALGRPLLAGNEPCDNLSIPMCVLCLVHELEDAGIPKEDFADTREWAVSCFKLHIQRNGTRVLENVTPDGKEIQGSDGRLINPGHIIECGWFLLKESERIDSPDLRRIALKHFIEDPLDYGEDKKEGGLYYFLDADGYSPTHLEWDMKLWWPHCEALIATLMSHKITGKPAYWEQFKKVLHYSFENFVDDVNGEWFGYLSREGKVKLNFKGGPYKGCFHVPRALLMCQQMLTSFATEAEH